MTRCSILPMLTSSLGALSETKPFFDAPAPEGLRYSRDTAAQLRKELYHLLGTLPPRDRAVSAEIISEEKQDGYVLETLLLDLNGYEKVPALLARPANGDGPRPAVLFNHAHGGNYALGKTEFVAGRESLQNPPYARALTDMGYIGLCFDAWIFGARAHTTEQDMFKAMLWQDRVLWGMMVYDSIKAVDYLLTRKDVDASRIATMGLSMGSTMAWWLAALDERIAVTVDLCCLTDLHAFLHRQSLEGHGIYYFVPGLLNRFSTSDINALIAPRPHLSVAGLRDGLTPPEGLDRIDANLKQVYAAWGAADSWRLLRCDAAHQETAEGRREIMAFLRQQLG